MTLTTAIRPKRTPRPRQKHFKRKGGVIALPRDLLRSDAYRALQLPARCLLIELQDVWSFDRPIIHYSARRAAEALNVSPKTAARAFTELTEAGFIVMAGESDWLNGKAREYKLTWLPTNGREPTDEWASARPTCHQGNGRPGKRVTRVTVDSKPDPKPVTRERQNNGLDEATAA